MLILPLLFRSMMMMIRIKLKNYQTEPTILFLLRISLTPHSTISNNKHTNTHTLPSTPCEWNVADFLTGIEPIVVRYVVAAEWTMKRPLKRPVKRKQKWHLVDFLFEKNWRKTCLSIDCLGILLTWAQEEFDVSNWTLTVESLAFLSVLVRQSSWFITCCGVFGICWKRIMTA